MDNNTDAIMSAHYRIGKREFKERYEKAWTRKKREYRYMERSEILKMQMLNNNVLLEVPRKDLNFVDMETAGGKVGFVSRFSEIYHAPTFLKVVTLPERLRFGVNDMMVDMEWKTQNELKVGDYVISRYIPVVQALSIADSYGVSKCFYDEDRRLYILVNYRDLICRLRDAGTDSNVRVGKSLFAEGVEGDFDLYPLNGWVLTEPIDERSRSGIEFSGEQRNKSVGRVVEQGARIEKYKFPYSPDCGTPLEGHLTMFTSMGDVELMRGPLNKLGRDLRRIPKRHCLCLVTNEDGSPISSEEL